MPFQINLHYVDADPDSTFMGETREERIEEFLEENDCPVLAMYEGSWLRVHGRPRHGHRDGRDCSSGRASTPSTTDSTCPTCCTSPPSSTEAGAPTDTEITPI